MTGQQLNAMPPLRWCIKGILPAHGIAQLYGPSTAGKSFLCFDMATAIAEGRPWFGYRTTRYPVVIVATEGQYGLKLRAQAWQQHHQRPLPDTLYFVIDEVRINHPSRVARLAEQLPAHAIVIIDTQSAAAPGTDENNSADMGRIIEGAKQLAKHTGGLTVLVHHTGKDPSKGARGHSSQQPAMDACLEVCGGEGRPRAWVLRKSKDATDGQRHAFALQVITLGQDSDGESITSCVINPDSAEPVRGGQLTDKQQRALDNYRKAAATVGTTDHQGLFIGLHPERWRAVFYADSPLDSDSAKKKDFTRQRQALVAKGLLIIHEQRYRPHGPSAAAEEQQFTRQLADRLATPP